MPISITSPIDGSTIQTNLAMDGASTLEQKIRLAVSGQKTLRKTTYAQRAQWLLRAADILEAEKSAFAAIMTSEMGKTLASAEAEAVKCATVCRYYAAHAESFLADTTIATEATRSFVRFQPLGVILAIMPWNYPFWQVFRFAAPALMSGNSGLLKHAMNVPQCAAAIADIFTRAGFPAGALQSLFIDIDATQALIEDDRVAAVTLTGSERAGSAVGAAAGKHIKKAILELGGSDPLILMPSADLPLAIATAVKSRMINTGQSCIAAKRILIHDSIYDGCERDLIAAVKALRVGDPRDPATEIGPMATAEFAKNLHAQVKSAVAQGARILTGGCRSTYGAAYYEPTLLAGLPRNAAVCREEFFGPVAMLFRFRDIDEAITLANDTPFGLSASVWTNDPAEQERFIDEIEAGQVFLNSMTISDARMPFGGIKRSGIGRELGAWGIREFVNVKAVSCA